MKALTLELADGRTMTNSTTSGNANPGDRPTTMSPPRRATIEDVATAAGVSVATVSRALRGLPNVAVSTRERVNDVAMEMSYRPDPAAARLAAGRTGTIAIAVPSINSWYFSTVVAGAEAVSADAGLEFQIIGVPGDAERDRLLDDDRRLERRTDGVILVDVRITAAQVDSLERRKLGLATIGTSVTGHPAVCIDDERVGEMAADHLLELGHERIGVIGGLADDPMNFDVPKARRRGFERSLRASGLGVDHDMAVSGNFGIRGGVEAMNQLLDANVPPSAVFAMSDEMAFGAIKACNERGLAPGADVSIIGVDDHEFSHVVELTTIRQPVADHGARAARMLLASMERARDPDASGTTPVDDVFRPELELIARATTAPPRR